MLFFDSFTLQPQPQPLTQPQPSIKRSHVAWIAGITPATAHVIDAAVVACSGSSRSERSRFLSLVPSLLSSRALAAVADSISLQAAVLATRHKSMIDDAALTCRTHSLRNPGRNKQRWTFNKQRIVSLPPSKVNPVSGTHSSFVCRVQSEDAIIWRPYCCQQNATANRLPFTRLVGSRSVREIVSVTWQHILEFWLPFHGSQSEN